MASVIFIHLFIYVFCFFAGDGEWPWFKNERRLVKKKNHLISVPEEADSRKVQKMVLLVVEVSLILLSSSRRKM